MKSAADQIQQRLIELEREVAIWRAAAVAENDYANSHEPAGSIAEMAIFQRLQLAIQQRAPLRMAAIDEARAAAKRAA